MLAAVLAATPLVSLRHAEAAYLRDVPQELVQPDGSVIRCFASGDEHYHWLHDADGFVIVKDPESGFWVWGAKEAGRIVATDHVVGRVPPDVLGLEPRIFPDREVVKSQSVHIASPPSKSAPTAGTINSLVVFIRFSGDSEFTESISAFETGFNSTAGGASSLKAYYDEVSGGQLTIDSTFYPTPAGSTVVSYQDAHSRAYFQPFDETTNPIGYTSSGERTTREHTLLKNAVDAISPQVPGGLDIDSDSDGAVDSVVFIIKGGPDGWSDLLWPHRWVLYSQAAYINGKQVWDYNFQLSSWFQVGVLCHEMFHTLGAPDLYHYDQDFRHLSPVGHWDLMEQTTDPPQHMLMHMKQRYGGWIASIPEITTSGTYTLNPVTASTDNALRIASPYTSDEYFVVEYRRQQGIFEGSVPGSGLIVYRIDATLEGNAAGPPDEVYIYRPGGTTTTNGSPDSAFFTLDAGRTEINDSTNPSSFLADGSPGGLVISDVTTAGDTISFEVTIDADHFSLTLAPESQQVCKGQNATFTVTLGQYGDFTGPVNLVATSRPVGSTASFSSNQVATVPGTSTLTIGTVNASLGTSTVSVAGTGTPGTRTDSSQLTLITVPGSPALQSPADGTVNVENTPTFVWSSVAGATSYTIEIDDEPSFVGLVHTAVAASTNYSGASLDPGTTYYWRVRASNSCGLGTASTVLDFTTSDGSTVCSSILLEPGFEGGRGSAWQERSDNEWPLVTEDYPRTGAYSAWLGGGNNESAEVWQSPTISGSATSATLTYWFAADSSDDCGYDSGGLEVNGASVAGHTYDLCETNNTNWVQSSTANLLAYAGTSPAISFVVDTDSSYSSSLFIDDVVLEVCVPGSEPDAIFSADFESGDASSWSSVSQ
jgi:M6 family metalloprotease-like protein